jgi:hypothetical protein
MVNWPYFERFQWRNAEPKFYIFYVIQGIYELKHAFKFIIYYTQVINNIFLRFSSN